MTEIKINQILLNQIAIMEFLKSMNVSTLSQQNARKQMGVLVQLSANLINGKEQAK